MHEGEPSDALTVLADETRIAILRALADAEGALAFSELRRRAGVDDAGRFNYHLSKLREYFVREVDGGYALRHAGSRVVAAAEDVDPEAATLAVDPGSPVEGPDPQTVSGSGSGPNAGSGPNSGEGPNSEAGTNATEVCPVCGEDECERLFHVHLSVPWR